MTTLPPNVPKSPIVYNKAKFSLYHQIIMIYQKYIDIDAPLSINLSSETRDRLDKTLTTLLKLPSTPITNSSSNQLSAFHIIRQTTMTYTTTNTLSASNGGNISYQEPELWGLLTVFEDCLQELYRLLNSSWKRLREKLKKGMVRFYHYSFTYSDFVHFII